MRTGNCPSYSERDFHELVHLIYDSAADPGGWNVFLNKLFGLYHASCTALLWQDFDVKSGFINLAVNVDPDYQRLYEEYYGQINIWFNKGRDLFQPGRMLTAPEVLPYSELERSEYYNDYLRPQGFYRALGGVVLREGSSNSILTITRAHRKEEFGPEDVSFLQSLLPHMIRALQFHSRISMLESERSTMVSALDQFPQGVVLADGSGKVLLANSSAQRILGMLDGLSVVDGLLHAAQPAENTSLQGLILGAASTGMGTGVDPGGYLNVSRPSAKRPFSLLIAPLALGRYEVGTEAAATAVFITDPEQQSVSQTGYLQSQYRLTASEVELVRALGNGESVKQAAGRLAITFESARTRLKRIFQKTGTARQTDLIRLLLRIPGRSTAL